jgi:Lar family restriction alleviation protein
MSNIKPCPFCGAPAEVKIHRGMTFIKCVDCGARTGYYFNGEHAKKFWNRRKDDDAEDTDSQVSGVQP